MPRRKSHKASISRRGGGRGSSKDYRLGDAEPQAGHQSRRSPRLFRRCVRHQRSDLHTDDWRQSPIVIRTQKFAPDVHAAGSASGMAASGRLFRSKRLPAGSPTAFRGIPLGVYQTTIDIVEANGATAQAQLLLEHGRPIRRPCYPPFGTARAQYLVQRSEADDLCEGLNV